MSRPTFVEAMGALLEEYRDEIAPTTCSVCGDIDAQDCPHSPVGETAVVVQDTVSTGWLVIHTWASFAEANSWFDWTSDKSMSMTGAIGLLEAVKQDALRSL